MNIPYHPKPPLGIEPIEFWLEKNFMQELSEKDALAKVRERLGVVEAAIKRYQDALFPVPTEWFKEQVAHVELLAAKS